MQNKCNFFQKSMGYLQKWLLNSTQENCELQKWLFCVNLAIKLKLVTKIWKHHKNNQETLNIVLINSV